MLQLGEWGVTEAGGVVGLSDDDQLRKTRKETGQKLVKFARTKIAPIPGFFWDWFADWVTITGERRPPGEFIKLAKEGKYAEAIGKFAKDPIVTKAMPIFASDVIEGLSRGWQEGGAMGALSLVSRFAPAFGGIGVQDYERRAGYFKGEKSPNLGKELDKFGLEYEYARRLPGEPDKLHRERALRIEQWLIQFGEKLVTEPAYKRLPAEKQKAAIKELRDRIGQEANQRRPNLTNFYPSKVLMSIERSERRKPIRDREKIYVGEKR
jgi:hypothetical protein